MLISHVASAVLLTGSVSSARPPFSDHARTRSNFVRDMEASKMSSTKSSNKLSRFEFERAAHGKSEDSTRLRRKIMAKATHVPAGADRPAQFGGGRKLEEAANDGGEGDNNYQNYYEGNDDVNGGNNYNNNNNYANNKNNANRNYNYQYSQNSNYKYDENSDGSDDYFQGTGQFNNMFGFDPTQFSLSYHRCANVKQWSDDMASEEDTDTVLATRQFAVFRFCPEATCMGWIESDWECEVDDEYCERAKDTAYRNGWTYDQFMAYKNWEMEYGSQYEYEQKQKQKASAACNDDDDEMGSCEQYYDGTYRKFSDFYEPEQTWGATGEGCQSNYGEYLVTLEDYLQIMLEWQEERIETYIEYCYECMMNAYNNWMTYASEQNNQYAAQNNQNYNNYNNYQYNGNNYNNGNNNNYNNNNGNYRRDLKDVTFEQFKDDEFMKRLVQDHAQDMSRRLEEENQDEEAEWMNQYQMQMWEDMKVTFYEACPEYDLCSEYQNVQAYLEEGEDDDGDDITQFFECTEVERNNGNVAYIGPHCAEDGFTVTLGVFADEDCFEYIGYGVDIRSFIDDDEVAEELANYAEDDPLRSYYNSANGPSLDMLAWSNEWNVCIPCNQNSLMFEEDNEFDYQNYNQNSAQTSAEGDGEVNELCQTMYMYAARCDKHFRTYSARTKMAKYEALIAQEDLTCEFIESIVNDNYDEMGYVNLDADGNYNRESNSYLMNSNSIYAQRAGEGIAKVTPLQVFGLIGSLAACAILAVWSSSLHKSLSKGAPWRPRRGLNSSANQPGDLTRQDSGIVMGRSQSHASYYMS